MAAALFAGGDSVGLELPSVVAWLGLSAAAACVVGCSDPDSATVAPASDAGASVSVQARAGFVPTYPCTQCHEHAPGRSNPQVRELTELHTHTNEFAHGDLAGWCYQCHAQSDLDKLVLPDGRQVSFDESHELCGGCHGEKAIDWRAGIHGLTTGRWNGPQVRRSCTHCHDPHRTSPVRADALPHVPDYRPSAPLPERAP